MGLVAWSQLAMRLPGVMPGGGGVLPPASAGQRPAAVQWKAPRSSRDEPRRCLRLTALVATAQIPAEAESLKPINCLIFPKMGYYRNSASFLFAFPPLFCPTELQKRIALSKI